MVRQGLPTPQNLAQEFTALDRRDAPPFGVIEEGNLVWMLLDRLRGEAFDMNAERVLGFRIDERVEIAIYRHADRLTTTPEEMDQQGVTGTVIGNGNLVRDNVVPAEQSGLEFAEDRFTGSVQASRAQVHSGWARAYASRLFRKSRGEIR